MVNTLAAVSFKKCSACTRSKVNSVMFENTGRGGPGGIVAVGSTVHTFGSPFQS
jgi:hypothetical protein